MNKTIATGLTGLVLALGAASCGEKDVCDSMNYQGMKGMYNEATYSSTSYNMTKANADNEPECREGCTYKSDVGCCWCPD